MRKKMITIILVLGIAGSLFAACGSNALRYDQELSGFEFPEDAALVYEYEQSTWDRGSRFALYQFDEESAPDILSDIENADYWVSAPMSETAKELYDRIIFPKDSPLSEIEEANGYYKIVKPDSPGDFYLLFYDLDSFQLTVLYDRD